MKSLICELGGESRAEVLNVGRTKCLRGHSLTSEWAAETSLPGYDISNFTAAPCIFILSSIIYYPTDAQLNIPKRMVIFTLKLTSKVLLHVSV